jgi:hypothetical protein
MGYSRKHGRVTTERKEVPDDEPVFVIRAADALACPLLSAYYNLCGENGAAAEHTASVEAEYTRFADWQEAHPDRVKVPDTLPGEYWQGPSALVVVITQEEPGEPGGPSR